MPKKKRNQVKATPTPEKALNRKVQQIVYREAHREELLAKSRAYYRRNRKKELARKALYRANNREKLSENRMLDRLKRLSEEDDFFHWMAHIDKLGKVMKKLSK